MLCFILWGVWFFYCTSKFHCSFLSEISLLAWQQFTALKLEEAASSYSLDYQSFQSESC